jgi:hypothetical protein
MNEAENLQQTTNSFILIQELRISHLTYYYIDITVGFAQHTSKGDLILINKVRTRLGLPNWVSAI